MHINSSVKSPASTLTQTHESDVSASAMIEEKSQATEETVQHASLRSVYLKRAMHKISARGLELSAVKNISTQPQHVNTGTNLSIRTQARPYLKLFLAGAESDKNRK